MSKTKSSFLREGSILAIASILSRIMGLLFRAPLEAAIGPVGYGAYSQAMNVYNFALQITLYGVPICISKLVSGFDSKKEYRNSYNLCKYSIIILGAIGLLVSLALMIFAKPISLLFFKNDYTPIPLFTLAPTIFVFSILSVFRGFFQGKHTSVPTGISQIIEQFFHVVIGLVLANVLIKVFANNVNASVYGAAGATFAIMLGALGALIYLIILYFVYKPYHEKKLLKDSGTNLLDWRTLLKQLFIAMIPVLLYHVLYSVSELLDEIIYNNIYASRLEADIRTILSGKYTGKYRVMTNLPISLGSAMGIAAVTTVVSSFSRKDMEETADNTKSVIKFNMLLAFPMAIGLAALSEPVMAVILHDTSEVSRKMLAMGAFAIVFFIYATATNSILQGINRLRYGVLHAAIALLIYLISDFIMLYFMDMNVYGLVIGNTIFPLVICILNTITLKHNIPFKFDLMKTFILPFINSAVMGIVSFGTYKIIYKLLRIRFLGLAFGILVGAFVYFVLAIKTKTIEKEEIEELPKGKYLVKIARKIRLI